MEKNIDKRALTSNIANRGDMFRIQHFVYVSAFLSVDSDTLRNPRHAIFENR